MKGAKRAALNLHNVYYILIYLECPSGFHGLDCKQKCLCKNNATCGYFDGYCTCQPGYIGDTCEQSRFPFHFEKLYYQILVYENTPDEYFALDSRSGELCGHTRFFGILESFVIRDTGLIDITLKCERDFLLMLYLTAWVALVPCVSKLSVLITLGINICRSIFITFIQVNFMQDYFNYRYSLRNRYVYTDANVTS